jgi:hypothetical protein
MLTESIIIIVVFSVLFIIGSIALNKINQNLIMKDIGITDEQLKKTEDYVSQKIKSQLDEMTERIDTLDKFYSSPNTATQLCVGNVCTTPNQLSILNGSQQFRIKSKCNGVLNKTGCNMIRIKQTLVISRWTQNDIFSLVCASKEKH